SELVTSAVRGPPDPAAGDAPATAMGVAAVGATRVGGPLAGAWVGAADGALHAAASRPNAVVPRRPRNRRRVVSIASSIPVPVRSGQNCGRRLSDGDMRRRHAPETPRDRRGWAGRALRPADRPTARPNCDAAGPP